MKNRIDESIKSSLEGYELPYDAQAWDAMSKKLDQHVPKGNQGSNMKWYLGGAAVIGVIIASAIFMNQTEQSEQQLAKSEATETVDRSEKTTQSKTTQTQNSSTNSGSAAQENSSNVTVNTNSTPVAGGNESTMQRGNVPDPASIPGSTSSGSQSGTQRNPDNSGTIPSADPNVTLIVTLPEIGSKCQGETFVIDNKNDVALVLISPSGDESPLRAKTKNSVSLDESGVYQIAYMKNQQIMKQNTFNVLAAPSVDLSYDPVNIYDKGLPSIQMRTNSVGTSFEWKIQGTSKPLFGKEVNAHLFNKGTYKVNLTVTGVNGCSAVESMNVTMPEDYNLMAVNAINPNSHIEKNRAFMPHALKERNTPFTLVIIDPASGAIIFESSDVNNPWTGIDRRNGQMVEVNRPFVWKVSLQKPLEGEKAEYKGTVILQ